MQKISLFKLAVICGGPSLERGISLNSARSIFDHLQSPSIDVSVLYVDFQRDFHLISTSQLYSNTPSDFDFKLNYAKSKLNSNQLETILKGMDLVFSVIHGFFGEDGQIQSLLEKYQIPFVGHSSESCQWMFHKFQAAETLRGYGFPTLPQILFSRQQDNPSPLIEEFFRKYSLSRAIVKPAIGGSSINVYSVNTSEEALERMKEIFSNDRNAQVLLEPFCEGREFTVVVFENFDHQPVALIPTEVELSDVHNQIFDYRKKYLPTNQTSYHTPPRFSLEIVEQIRLQAEQIFKLFKMRDFVRIDGWLMRDGTIYFTDINPISGLEQNSFLFRQASLVGFNHREALEYILKNACRRYHIEFPECPKKQHPLSKLPVYVLFGNHNAERQVSLMSGTNVWLKLLQSDHHSPSLFFYDHEGFVWELPYSYALNHTVEEIYSNCIDLHEENEMWKGIFNSIRSRLNIVPKPLHLPHRMLLNQFLERTKREEAFVFIALHGGDGENGTLQRLLESYQIPFNGSHASASELCMDKYLTGQAITALEDSEILSVPKLIVSFTQFEHFSNLDFERVWRSWRHELQSECLIVKPRFDGCSAGIILLQSASDLARYSEFLFQKLSRIPAHSFTNQPFPVEMSSQILGEYLIEQYIETDEIRIQEGQLLDFPKKGWIELTTGVLEQDGIYHALNPSITISEGTVLSLEEKFQGGTGINLTPPPKEILSPSSTQKIKDLVEKTAKALGIQNYARIDLFFNRFTEKVLIIEANTLPGMTPSTVLYHQALAEDPPMTPLALLDRIISSKLSASLGCMKV